MNIENKRIQKKIRGQRVGGAVMSAIMPFVPLIPVGAATLLFKSCNHNPENPDLPRDQIQTINLFNNQSTATVKGHMTDAHFSVMKREIAQSLDAWYTNMSTQAARDTAKTIFARPEGVTYIIEVNPTEFNRWRTNAVTEPGIARIALEYVDSALIEAAILAIFNRHSIIDGILIRNAAKPSLQEIQIAEGQPTPQQIKALEGQVRRNNFLGHAQCLTLTFYVWHLKIFS
ncbi:MAG: hypothetical protein FWC97_11160 [Treponema sp.]|nr:hypothetical protein [Treponema sp.]